VASLGSYAVVWEEGDGRRHTGRLDVYGDRLDLEGRSRGDRWRLRHVRFCDVAGVLVERSEGDRTDGLRTLVLELTGGSPVRIRTLGGNHLLSEITDLLARRRRTGSTREM
jgi:hypothetical protein